MNVSEQRHLYGAIDRVPQIAAVVAAAVGVLVIIGWLLDLEALKSGLPGLTAMKANTAFCFILSGVSLWVIQTGDQSQRSRIVSRLCAGAVLLVGLLTLGEYLSCTDFGIDQLLIRDISDLPGDIPGRMAVNTALSFAALGAALLLLSMGKGGMVMAVNTLTMVPIVAAGSALIGYAFDIEDFLRAQLSYTPMAVNTSVAFVLLALGLVNARPDYPFRRLMTSDSAAGVTVRRLLPAAIGFSLVAGWMILQGYHAGYFSAPFALALFSATSIAGLGALILWIAGALLKAEIQRERTEEERHTAAQYARSLIEASLDPLVTISVEGKITDVNEATVAATGVPRKQLIGSDFSEYFTDPDTARTGYQEVFAKGFVTDYPLTLRHVSGGTKQVLYNASVYRNAKGEVAGVFAAARDITELKRVEEDLRKTQSLLNETQHVTKLGGWEYDVAAQRVVWTDEVYRIHGVSKDYDPGNPKQDMKFYAPDDQEAIDEAFQQAIEKGIPYDLELKLVNAQGERLWVRTMGRAERKQDVTVRVFGNIMDITERKQAEEELRKYHEHLEELVRERTSLLEAANRDLEGFAYSVSHELRIPLRAVDGFSNMLLKRYPDKLDEEGKRYLNVVRDHAQKMARLIDDILAFSRVGRLRMSVSEIDTEALVRAVSRELQPGVAGRELTMEIKPLPHCHGDQAMLHQVWFNLLGNAIKFTRPHPAARVEVGGHTNGEETIYYVKDDGVGFDMQYVGKLFGEFQRLHGIEEFEGTGAGLAIVKRIITRHGGRVWAEGKVDEGATFYFALPLHQGNAQTLLRKKEGEYAIDD